MGLISKQAPVIFAFATAFLLAAGLSETSLCQTKYPTRPISILCPYSPGGTLDVVSRIGASYFSEKFGVPVNIINKPGGNTIPATLEVMNSTADGYTLLAESQASCSLLVLVKDLPFKIMDRTYITAVTNAPMLLLVPGSSPWQTLGDLVNAVKKNADGFTWISGGSASVPAYVIRKFFASIGVDVLKTREVMAKGGGEQMTQVAGGHVNLTALAPASTLPAIKAGTIRPLAITSRARHPMLPNVPTTKELGYPDVDIEVWGGFSGPLNLPPEVTDTWNKAVQKAQGDPKFLSGYDKVGVPVFYRNSAEARTLVLKEMEEVKKLWGIK